MSNKRRYDTQITLTPFDDLFSTQEEREDSGLEKVKLVPLTEQHPFPNHPFSVRDDEDMQKLVDSIKENGVMMPASCAHRAAGGYEMISGHRRMHASARANLQELPVLIREMNDDAAVLLMVDSNVQRENIRPSEKAKAYQMKLKALKRPGQRTDLTSGQFGQKSGYAISRDKVAADANESSRNVQRYIRLNNLIPELMEMVDDNKLKFNPAVEISYLTPEEQKECFEYLDSQSCTPSLSQVQKLKAASRNHKFTQDRLEKIMTSQPPSVKPRAQQIVLPLDRIAWFFPQNATSEKIVDQILHLLEVQYRNRNRGGFER